MSAIIPCILILLITIGMAVQEAVIYHVHPPRRYNKPDEHIFYSITRVITFGGFSILSEYWIVILIAGICCFPLLHDSAYYQMRKILSGGDVYPDGWLTNSAQGTTSKMSMDMFGRICLAVLGSAFGFVLQALLQLI